MATIIQDIDALVLNLENWWNGLFASTQATAEANIQNTLNANQAALTQSLTSFTTNAVQQAVQNSLNQVSSNLQSSGVVNNITSGLNIPSNNTTSQVGLTAAQSMALTPSQIASGYAGSGYYATSNGGSVNVTSLSQFTQLVQSGTIIM